MSVTSSSSSSSSVSSITDGGTTCVDQPVPDGRAERRTRNVGAVRVATIELLREGRRPSLNEIAERSGIASRSVYRYFGDADAAVADAVNHLLRRAHEVFRSEPAIGPAMPLDERLAMLILRRLRLDRLVEPIDLATIEDRASMLAPVAVLDDEVRSAFSPELARHGGDAQLDGVLCALFRLRSVRSMRSAFGGSDEATAAALSRTVNALFADAAARTCSRLD